MIETGMCILRNVIHLCRISISNKVNGANGEMMLHVWWCTAMGRLSCRLLLRAL